jgi:serine/threonine-protein kinase
MATEQTPAPFTPSNFGRYYLLERLAIGGMAEIFKARQTGAHGFEKIIVIKRILPHLAADPEFLAMFIDEAKLQCALMHPKIVQVLEFGQVDNQYYIALEYIDGMDTLGLLRACAHRRMRLPVRLAVHIASEVLDALDFAHSQRAGDGSSLGIVHRDVSPSNVFISKRGDVKLGDFGIARAAEKSRQSKTQAGTLKGKYGYMAPEQVVGNDIDGRADQFAVGIVLAEMLMGRRLFTAPNDLDVLLMVRDARLERLDRHGTDIPPMLRQILNRMLSKSSTERFPSAASTRDALQDFLFEARQRVGASDLGMFLDNLKQEDQRTEPVGDSGLIMIGEDTRARREAAEKQRIAVIKASKEPAVQRAAKEMEKVVTQEQQRHGSTPRLMLTPEQPLLTPASPPRTTQTPSTPPPEVVASSLMDLADTGPFIEPASVPTPSGTTPTPSVRIDGPATPSVRIDGPSTPTPIENDRPDLRGDFGEVTPARLFARLATDRETGQLVVENGEVVKEIFLVDGVPEFVASNVASERFGEYLVAHGVISPGELSMALAILPRFQGKLGDTLVGLSLLRPLEVFRHLTRQVREKIIDVFGWTGGHYRFYRGQVNQREAFPLGLDAFEILGAGVAGLPLDNVRARLEKVGGKRVRRVERPRPTPEHFRVGAGPRELWQRLDGKRTVHEWIRRYDQPEQLLTLCRTLYLLIESDLAALD